jgi:hypothetical protein
VISVNQDPEPCARCGFAGEPYANACIVCGATARGAGSVPVLRLTGGGGLRALYVRTAFAVVVVVVGSAVLTAVGSSPPAPPRAAIAVSPAPRAAASPVATSAADQLPALQPLSAERTLSDQIDAAWAAENWAGAIDGLEALRRVNPNALDYKDKLYAAHYFWAKALADAGDKQAAVNQLTEAQRIDPERGEGRTLLAELAGEER